MPTAGRTESKLLDLNTYGCVIFGTAESVVGTIELELLQGAIGSTVLTIKRTNSGRVLHALPSATTLSSATMTADLSAVGPGAIAVDVTTLAGAAAVAQIHAHFKGDT